MGGELLKRFNSILKISIFILILITVIGAVSAQDIDVADDDSDEDIDFDTDLDDSADDDSDEDIDLDDSQDKDEFDDESDDLDDFTDEDEDEDDSDWEEEDDFNESDDEFEEDNVTDFEYLSFRIDAYLQKFGNATSDDWYLSEEFLNGLQSFDSNNLTQYLNESDENFEIYSKIYNSIISTFDKYNLTDNETEYLKFYILYFLNHFANCTDYEWNESDEFSDFHISYLDSALMIVKGCAFACGSAPFDDLGSHMPQHLFDTLDTYALKNSNTTDNVNNCANFTVNNTNPNDYNWILILLILLISIILII